MSKAATGSNRVRGTVIFGFRKRCWKIKGTRSRLNGRISFRLGPERFRGLARNDCAWSARVTTLQVHTSRATRKERVKIAWRRTTLVRKTSVSPVPDGAPRATAVRDAGSARAGRWNSAVLVRPDAGRWPTSECYWRVDRKRSACRRNGDEFFYRPSFPGPSDSNRSRVIQINPFVFQTAGIVPRPPTHSVRPAHRIIHHYHT